MLLQMRYPLAQLGVSLPGVGCVPGPQEPFASKDTCTAARVAPSPWVVQLPVNDSVVVSDAQSVAERAAVATHDRPVGLPQLQAEQVLGE